CCCRSLPLPLFPYTTLFRSPFQHLLRSDFLRKRKVPKRAGSPRQRSNTLYASFLVLLLGAFRLLERNRHFSFFLQAGETRLKGGDRKSTRLNSSHQIISYAV